MQSVLVLDFGSQYTQLIARRIRELGIYSEILPYSTTPDTIREHNPRAIILSGGPISVYGESAILPNPGIFSLGLPILGICYGLQAITNHFGGAVEGSSKQEFGRAKILVDRKEGHESILFEGIPDSDVWMSHGDKVTRMPEGFRITASSGNSEMCAIESYGQKAALKIYGLQFHPEVQHSLYGNSCSQTSCSTLPALPPTGHQKALSITRLRIFVSVRETILSSAASAAGSTPPWPPYW